MIVSYLPAGKMEAFFKVTSDLASPPSKKETGNIFKVHDMIVIGPPLTVDE